MIVFTVEEEVVVEDVENVVACGVEVGYFLSRRITFETVCAIIVSVSNTILMPN